MPLVYDPPNGWKYDFPKLYQPKSKDEPLHETLLRDGYPEEEIKNGGAKHVRFWEAGEE